MRNEQERDADKLETEEARLAALLAQLRLESVAVEQELRRVRAERQRGAKDEKEFQDGDLVEITGGNGYRGRKAVLEPCENGSKEFWWLHVRKRRGDAATPRIKRKVTNFRLIRRNNDDGGLDSQLN